MKTTKKTAKSSKNRKSDRDELRTEYHFDYRKTRPNRFARRAGKPPLIFALDPDVAKAFSDSQSVNRALRALLKAYPK